MTVLVECSHVSKQYSKSAEGIKSLLISKTKFIESRYSRSWALQDINFTVEKGKSLGIVGHNGTGKSTLLSLLLGTITADAGEILVDGKVASLLELGAGFHPELTGRENIYLYGSILGMHIKEINELYDSIVSFSELSGAIENPIRTYSNGMVARLGFSIIIHTKADILLIDEVLAVGDSAFQEKCIDYLQKFKASNGTLIIVSHDMETLEAMCEHGICLDMGKIVKTGDIVDVINHHKELMAKHV